MNPIDGSASARQYMAPSQPGSEVSSPGAGNQVASGSSVAGPAIQAPNEAQVRSGASVDGDAAPTSVTTESEGTTATGNQQRQGGESGGGAGTMVDAYA
jgi:hypothetical protein